MERIAIIELNEKGTNLLILDSVDGKVNPVKELVDNFSVGDEIVTDQLIKPKTVTKMVSVLTIYREIIQSYSVTKIVGFASKSYLKARNQKGFFEELYNNTGVVFSILNDEETVKHAFNAINNKIDASKAYSIFVDRHVSYFFKFNRRTVLEMHVIPFGSENLGLKNLSYNEMVDLVKEEIKKLELPRLEENDMVIGIGDALINFGRLAKKIDHYPIDIDNNYQISQRLIEDTLKFVKGLDLEKIKKVKGMRGTPTTFLSGIAIINAFFGQVCMTNLTISDAKVMQGVIQQNTEVEGIDKLTDLLGNSFANYYEFHKNDFSTNYRVANMAGILFKQLKVMHKLPRLYVKPMRIAAYMYDCGKNINFDNYEKHSLYEVLNSGICGVSQKDLLLAGFICICQSPDNFSLSEWMKYKDIVSEEDLDAVRKLGVIVKLASNLNSTKKEIVTDIVCDILGDSIIVKTVVNGDATYDIMQGMKVADDYRKIFKKNLQII